MQKSGRGWRQKEDPVGLERAKGKESSQPSGAVRNEEKKELEQLPQALRIPVILPGVFLLTFENYENHKHSAVQLWALFAQKYTCQNRF